MSTGTAIEWTEATWNPTTGCDRVSPGCDHCYALTLAGRLKAMGQPKYQTDGDPRTSGPGFGLTMHSDALSIPLHWREPRRVFVNSMSDLFHARVTRQFIARVWDVMSRTPQHTYQILTKRPKHMARVLNDMPDGLWQLPLPNVWLGTSVERQDEADERIPALLDTPAAVRWVSAEPLLGPVDLARWMHHPLHYSPTDRHQDSFSRCTRCHEMGGASSLHTVLRDGTPIDRDGKPLRSGLSWLVAGGESGPGARPVHPDWLRSLRDQCTAARVPFFFKQWGGRTPKAGGRELDGRTWDEYPDAATVAAPDQSTSDTTPAGG